MSEPTVIDAEYEVTGTTQVTLEDRIAQLEGIAKGLLQGQKSILEHFREMIAAVTEISEESSEE